MKKQILLIFILVFLINIVSAVTIDNVFTTPKEIAPGKTFDVFINIENIFDYDVENLNVKLNLEDIKLAPYQSSSEKFIDELNDGEDEEFEFKLIVLPDASSGIYKIPVEISYLYNRTNTKTGLISVIVNSEPELKVSSENTALIKGKENTLSLRVTNSGLADIKFMYLSLQDISSIDIISENEQYMGDIDNDDFNSVEYKIYIDKDSPDNLNLPVLLKYKDATNKEFTETKILNLNLYSLKKAQNLGLVKKPDYTLFYIIFILILAYVIYRVIKKRKKSKK